MQQLRRSHINPDLLRDIISQYELGHQYSSQGGPTPPNADSSAERFWLPLPFNTGAYRAIPSAIKQFNSDLQYQHLWELVGRNAPNIGHSRMCRAQH